MNFEHISMRSQLSEFGAQAMVASTTLGRQEQSKRRDEKHSTNSEADFEKFTKKQRNNNPMIPRHDGTHLNVPQPFWKFANRFLFNTTFFFHVDVLRRALWFGLALNFCINIAKFHTIFFFSFFLHVAVDKERKD